MKQTAESSDLSDSEWSDVEVPTTKDEESEEWEKDRFDDEMEVEWDYESAEAPHGGWCGDVSWGQETIDQYCKYHIEFALEIQDCQAWDYESAEAPCDDWCSMIWDQETVHQYYTPNAEIALEVQDYQVWDYESAEASRGDWCGMDQDILHQYYDHCVEIAFPIQDYQAWENESAETSRGDWSSIIWDQETIDSYCPSNAKIAYQGQNYQAWDCECAAAACCDCDESTSVYWDSASETWYSESHQPSCVCQCPEGHATDFLMDEEDIDLFGALDDKAMPETNVDSPAWNYEGVRTTCQSWIYPIWDIDYPSWDYESARLSCNKSIPLDPFPAFDEYRALIDWEARGWDYASASAPRGTWNQRLTMIFDFSTQMYILNPSESHMDICQGCGLQDQVAVRITLVEPGIICGACRLNNFTKMLFQRQKEEEEAQKKASTSRSCEQTAGRQMKVVVNGTDKEFLIQLASTYANCPRSNGFRKNGFFVAMMANMPPIQAAGNKSAGVEKTQVSARERYADVDSDSDYESEYDDSISLASDETSEEDHIFESRANSTPYLPVVESDDVEILFDYHNEIQQSTSTLEIFLTSSRQFLRENLSTLPSPSTLIDRLIDRSSQFIQDVVQDVVLEDLNIRDPFATEQSMAIGYVPEPEQEQIDDLERDLFTDLAVSTLGQCIVPWYIRSVVEHTQQVVGELFRDDVEGETVYSSDE